MAAERDDPVEELGAVLPDDLGQLLFDPRRPEDIARAMSDILLDNSLRGRLERLGAQRRGDDAKQCEQERRSGLRLSHAASLLRARANAPNRPRTLKPEDAARAAPPVMVFDANGNLLPGNALPATIEGNRVLRPENSFSVLTNAFKINGQNWPNSALLINKDTNDIPKLLADSMNDIAPGVHAQAYNKVEFDLNNISEDFKNNKLLEPFSFIFDNIDSTNAKENTRCIFN